MPLNVDSQVYIYMLDSIGLDRMVEITWMAYDSLMVAGSYY